MSPNLRAFRTSCAVVVAAVAACSDGTTSPTPIDPNSVGLEAQQDTYSDRYDGGEVEVLSNQRVRGRTGKSIAEWGALWWKWEYDNPQVLGDLDGTNSALGDRGGPVFFAQGSGGDPVRASVIVPGGQYILLPVATYIWTLFDPCAELVCARQIVNRNFINGITSVAVTVDGERVPNMQSHLVRVDNSSPRSLWTPGRLGRTVTAAFCLPC